MKKIQSLGLSLVVVSTLTIGLVGCGGGGGSSSGGTSGGGDGSSSGGASGVSFPSNAVLATPTIENGKKVKDVVATNQISGTTILNSVNSNSKLNIGLLGFQVSKSLAKKIHSINLNTYSLNKVVDTTYNCLDGGTIHYSGNIDNGNGNGTLTLTVNNCVENNVKANGNIYASVSNYDANAGSYKDMSIKFTTNYTVTNLSNNSLTTISNGSYIDRNATSFNNYGNPKNLKLSMSIIATDGTQQYGIQNGIYQMTSHNGGESISMYQTSGKIYINNLGSYVNYDTSYDMSTTPLVFSYSVLNSGEARYNMANGGKVKIIAKSGVAKAYVDANGDGTYELSE